MSRVLSRRLGRLEQLAINSIPPKPWLVLNAGQAAPNPVPDCFGGVVQIVVFDGRKPQEDQ